MQFINIVLLMFFVAPLFGQNACPLVFNSTQNYTLTAGRLGYSWHNPVAVRPADSTTTPIATFYDNCELYSADRSSNLYDKNQVMVAYIKKNGALLDAIDCNDAIFARVQPGLLTLTINNQPITVAYKIYNAEGRLIGYIQIVGEATYNVLDLEGTLIAQATRYQTPHFLGAQSEWFITYFVASAIDSRTLPLVISKIQLEAMPNSPCTQNIINGIVAGTILGAAALATFIILCIRCRYCCR